MTGNEVNSLEHNGRRALILLAVLATLWAIHVARDVLMPIALAVIFSLILQPALSTLESWRLPKPLAAMLLVVALIGSLSASVWLLSSSALEWVQRLPESRDSLAQFAGSFQREVQEVDIAAKEIVAMAEDIMPGDATAQTVVVAQQSWQTDASVTAGQIILNGGLAAALLFFLLTSSRELILRCVAAQPDRRDRARALRALIASQAQLSRYLATNFAMNLCFGAVVGLCLWLLDFPDPALWGVIAFALRFVPFVGALVTAGLLAMVAAISFDALWIIVTVPLGFLSFSVLTAQFVDPLVYGLRFRLSPVIVFIWMLFWAWLWGVPGVLLAVPLLVLFQVCCQYIGWLSPVAVVIGGVPAASKAADE